MKPKKIKPYTNEYTEDFITMSLYYNSKNKYKYVLKLENKKLKQKYNDLTFDNTSQ